MAQLIAAFADFGVVVQDPVHGPDRAVINALVEQSGVDFGWGEIGKARLAQSVEHRLSFFGRQRAGRARSGRERRQWGGPTRAVAIDGGARDAQGVAGGGGEAVAGRQGRLHHGSSSLSGVARGIPSKEATFFWIPMIPSACASRRLRWAFSRLARASSAAMGLTAASFGPRFSGFRASKAPASR